MPRRARASAKARQGLIATVCAGLALGAAAATAASEDLRTTVTLAGAAPVSLHAEEQGEGPAVVLLPGLGESTFTWRKIVDGLARHHRVIALDLKGFGRSDKPSDGAYSADAQGALVAGFLAERGLDRVTLVGHSFGGTVALRTALHPEGGARVARLVVIAAPALPGSVAADITLSDIPAAVEAIALAIPPKTLARLLLSAAMGGGGVSDEAVEGYAAPYGELAAKHAFVATARTILSENGDEIADRYGAIRQPALLVWCRGDSIVPLRSGKRLARTLPKARLAVLERCHHLPQEERPEALLSVVLPFLKP